MGALISLAAGFAQLGLMMSKGIINSPVVMAGYSVSLSIANLAFVLGIIIIAIATILRLQSYGIKQLLIKLIAMAIIVNFGLVIAGTLLRASDSLSDYFISAVNPEISPLDPSGVITNEKSQAFVFAMTNAFGPQKLYSITSATSSDGFLSYLGKTFNPFAKLKDLFSVLVNMIFVIVFSAMIALAFLVLAVMLMIRYAYIGVLIVLLPLAWAAWVFPNFKQHWNKWWDHFLRWTFFSPILLFFLYLALLTTNGAAKYTGYLHDKVGGLGAQGGVTDALKNFFVGNAVQILQQLGQMWIVLTLVYAGFFAANSLGIAFAKEAMNSVTSAGKAAAKGIARKGYRGALRMGGTAMRDFGTGQTISNKPTWRQRLLNPLATKRTADEQKTVDALGKLRAAEAEKVKIEGQKVFPYNVTKEQVLARAEEEIRQARLDAEAAELKSGKVEERERERAQKSIAIRMMGTAKRLDKEPGVARSTWNAFKSAWGFEKNKPLEEKELIKMLRRSGANIKSEEKPAEATKESGSKPPKPAGGSSGLLDSHGNPT
ncbi:MAG: hypothetical protein V1489_00990 [Candidatus Liptonbacteria bacterium]